MANITFSYQGRVFTLSRKNIIQLLLVDNNYVKSDILLLEKIKEREKDNVSKFDYFRRSAGLIMLNSFNTDVSKMNTLKKKLGYQIIIPNEKDIYSELINFLTHEFRKETFDKWNFKHQDGIRGFITEAISNFSFPVFLALYYIYKNDDIKSLFDILNVLFVNQKPFYNSKIVNKKFFIINIIKRLDELKDNNFNSFTSGVKIYPFVNLIKNVARLTYTPGIIKDLKIQGENPYFVKNKKLAEKLKKINENKKLVLLEEEYSFPIYNYELLKQFYGIPVCITEGVGNYDYFFKMANVFDSDGSKKIFTRRTGSTEPEIVNDGYLSISDLIDELLNNQSNLVERGNFYFGFNDFRNKMKQGQNDDKIWLTRNIEINKMSLETESPWVNTNKSLPHQFVKLLSEQYFNDFHSPYMIKYGENNPFTSFKPEANFFRRLFPFKMNEDNEQKANLTVNFLSKYILADQLVKIPGGVVNEDQQFLNASLKENVEKHTPHSQSGKINNLRMIPNGTFVNGYFNNVVLLEELIRRVYYPYIVQYSNLFHTNLSGTTSFEALEEMAENFKEKGLPNINEKDTVDYNFYNIIFDRMVKTFLNDVHERKILQKSRINGRHFTANYSNPEKTNIIDFNDKKELLYSHKPSFGTYTTPTDINGLLSKINRVKYYGFIEEAFGDTAIPSYDINTTKNISTEIINHTGSDFYASQNEEHNKKYKTYDNLKNHLGTFLNKLFEYNYIATNSFYKKFHFIEANHEYNQAVSRVKPLEALKEMSKEITYEDLFYVSKIIPIHHANQTVDSNTVIDNWYNRAEKINSNKYNTNIARQLNINELVNSGLMGSISGIAGAHVYSSPLLEDYINDIIKNEYLFENQKNVKLLNKNMNMQDLRRQVILRLADEDAGKLLKTNFNKFNYSQMLEYIKNNKILPPYLEKEHLGFIKKFTQKFSKNNYVTIEDVNNAKKQLEEKFAEAIVWLENTPVRSNNIFINNTVNKPTQIDAFSTHFYYCFSDLLHKITNKKQYLDKISEISLKIDENVSYNEVVLKINELKELVLDTLINNVINENKEHDLISYFYVDDTNTSSAKPQFLKTVYYDLFRFIIEKNFEYLINEGDASEIEFKENKDCDILSKIFLIARTYEIFAEYHTGLHKFVEQVYPIVDYYKNIIEQVRKLPRWWFDAAPMFNYDGRALRTTVETTDPETLKKLEKANNDEYAHILSEAKPDSFVTHIKESWIEDKTFIQNRLYRYYVRPVYNFFIPVLYNFKGGKNANLNPNDGLPYRVISDILPANTLKETKPSKDYIKIPDHIVFQDSQKLFKQTHQTELADGNYKKYELNEITVNTKDYPKYKLKHKDFLSRYVTHDTSILIPVMFENKGNVKYSSFISNNTAISNESDIYTYNNSAIQNTNIKDINYHSENGEQIPVTFSSGVYTFNPYISNMADHLNFHTNDETRLQFSITAPFDSWISAVKHFLKQGKKVPKEYYLPDLKNFFDFTTKEWVEMFSDYKEMQLSGKKIYKYDYFNDLYKNKKKYFLYHHSSNTNYRRNKFALMPVLYRPVFIHRNNTVQVGYGLLDSKRWKASGSSWFVESEVASVASFFKAQGIAGSWTGEEEYFEFADIFDNRNTRKKTTSIADLVCQNWREIYLWKGYGQAATYHYSEKVKWNSYDGWYYFFGNYKSTFNEVGDIFKGHKFEYTGLPWNPNRQMNFRQEFIWALQEIRNDIYHNTVYFDENINDNQPLNNLIKPLYENFKKE